MTSFSEYPTVQNLQVRIQVLTKKSIQYNVTWTAPYLDHPAKQYYTITWCNSSNYCRNNLTHHTNYTIALHYGAGSYTVTVGVEYFTENEGSFARNVTFQITTPPRGNVINGTYDNIYVSCLSYRSRVLQAHDIVEFRYRTSA